MLMDNFGLDAGGIEKNQNEFLTHCTCSRPCSSIADAAHVYSPNNDGLLIPAHPDSRLISQRFVMPPSFPHQRCRLGGWIGVFHPKQERACAGNGGGRGWFSCRCDVGFDGGLSGGSGGLQRESGDEVIDQNDLVGAGSSNSRGECGLAIFDTFIFVMASDM